MTYLLDANILSELRRPRPDRSMVAWLSAQPPESLSISVVTIAEIERGILLAERSQPDHARRLSAWLEGQMAGFTARTISVSPDLGKDGHGSARFGC